VTRVLNLLGLELGARELLTAEPVADNPKGYWEHNQLSAISDAILKRYGGSWDEPPLLPQGWETSATIDDLKQRAQQLVKDQFDHAPLWGWKDPRTCLTLPFWQLLLPNLRYVICLRSPADVARSLARRDGLGAEKASLLWLTYVSSAFRHIEGKPHLVIFYEDLIDDCLRELERLGEFLGQPERAKQADVQRAARGFIEKGLQHHSDSIVKATVNLGIDLRARALYLAQRISVSLARNEVDGSPGLAAEMYAALDAVTQYAHEDSHGAEGMLQRLSMQVAEQARALQIQGENADETIRVLSAKLLETETELQRMKTTPGARLIGRLKRIKQ
jgi:hypothetical protein